MSCITNSIFALLLLSALSHATPEFTNRESDAMVINFLGPGLPKGSTYSFLELGLQKGNVNNGNFHLVRARDMTQARALLTLKSRSYPNAIRRFEARKEILQDPDLIPIKFPTYAGSYGYRVCYVNEANAQTFRAASPAKLSEFTYGLVTGWKDIEILKYNNYKISENDSVIGLYKQLSLNRIDAVCRGVVEIDYEKQLAENTKNIVLDDSKIISYNLPFFYFVHKDDIALAKKLESGLIKAYHDGSYHTLWKKFYEASLQDLHLSSRQILRLKSTVDQYINFNYQQYMPHFVGEPAQSKPQ